MTENVIYRIHLVCPSCGMTSQMIAYLIPQPKLNCADCLLDRREVVEMRIEAAEQL